MGNNIFRKVHIHMDLHNSFDCLLCFLYCVCIHVMSLSRIPVIKRIAAYLFMCVIHINAERDRGQGKKVSKGKDREILRS